MSSISALPPSADPKKLRSFGFLVGGAFALIAVVPLLRHRGPLRIWALAAAAALVLPALVSPRVLSPVYRAWMRAGAALGYVNNRIILGVLFYFVFTPVGWMFKIARKDPMRRGFERASPSYRAPRQPRPDGHMRNQF